LVGSVESFEDLVDFELFECEIASAG
jgi:hypothetical protein